MRLRRTGAAVDNAALRAYALPTAAPFAHMPTAFDPSI
jgi:hypothetical protein